MAVATNLGFVLLLAKLTMQDHTRSLIALTRVKRMKLSNPTSESERATARSAGAAIKLMELACIAH